MRKENSLKNLLYGLCSFVITTLIGIIIPRLFIVSYGSEANGLVSSLKQIFAYFALLEAGVGGATLQALYGPMARNDHGQISSILSATNHFYRKTGVWYAVGVALLAVIYPVCIKSDIPYYVIVGIILFQGEAGVLKYFVTSKLQLLMKVDGKSYILTNLGTFFTIICNIARIALMYSGCSILTVQAVFCIVDVLQVIFIVGYTKRQYGWLDLTAPPDYHAISQRNAVFVHQISGLIFNNTDTVILTFFCGLKVVSVYAMYSMLFGMAANVIGYISSSVNFAMGQIFNSDRERYKKIQEAYETYYLAVSFALFAIAMIFILPFLRLYTRGVSDIDYIDKWLPILFVAYQVLNYGRNTSTNIIDYAGHYSQTKWRSVLESGINLTVSLAAVHFLGIYGVLIGTVAALLYRTNDIILYANLKIMKRSAWPTYRRWLRNLVLLVLCGWLGSFLPELYSGYVSLFAAAIVVSVFVMALFLIVNTALEKGARATALEYLKPMLMKLIHR